MIQKLSNQYSNSIILKHSKFYFRQKCACFDFDHTIVRPKNQNIFSKDTDDWEWFNSNTKSIIKSYYDKGYAIVIFTNQNRRNKNIELKINQIKNVLDLLEIPYKAFILMDEPIKKPSNFSFIQFDKQNRLNKQMSFYVGDALGRKNDWSDSDKQFSINCQLPYYSPEEIFNIKKLDKLINIKTRLYQELVILVGYPGSGKTTLAESIFKKDTNYRILHSDDLKVESKIKQQLINNLENGFSVVIDATNPSIEKRCLFIKIAKSKNIKIRIIELLTSFEESLIRNNNREKIIPKIAFYVFRKKYQCPSFDENIDEIEYI